MLRGRQIAIIAAALLAGCKHRSPPPAGAAADATTDTPTDTPTDAPTDAPAPGAFLLDDRSVAAALERESNGEPVLLVERRGALVATNPSGKLARTLVPAPTDEADYDARTRVLWFNRGGRRFALDLAQENPSEIAVVDAMPKLRAALIWPPEPSWGMCGICVLMKVSAIPELSVSTEDFDKYPAGPRSAAEVEWRRAADRARPVLTDAGRTFLVGLYRRGRSPRGKPWILIGDTVAPMPGAARKLVTCSAGCGKSYAIPGLQRSLMIVGRYCDCPPEQSEGGCWAECVWFDSTRGRYASVRNPGHWGIDAKPERACHPMLDVTGTGYVIGGHVSPGPLAVCNATACRRERGRFLGWLSPGARTTDPADEDVSICPE